MKKKRGSFRYKSWIESKAVEEGVIWKSLKGLSYSLAGFECSSNRFICRQTLTRSIHLFMAAGEQRWTIKRFKALGLLILYANAEVDSFQDHAGLSLRKGQKLVLIGFVS